MTTFFIIRHGDRSSFNEDTSLNELGKKQAKLTALYLKSLKKIDLIYASPLNRAQETAEFISKTFDIPIITDTRIIERMEFRERRNETYEEYGLEWAKTSIDREYEPPLGDSSHGAGERFKSLLDEIIDNKKVVIVSHGGVIGDFLRNITTDNKLPLVTSSDGLYKYLDILNCSVTEVEKTHGDYKIRRVNDASHLASLNDI